MSKQEATRLADALRALHDSKQPHPTGPHGQMMGEESWRIVASGNQLYALMEAHDLLRRWPDGEPVALVADVYQSRYTLEWNGRSMPEGTPLFAAPPAESERIAERKWLDNECLDGGCQSLKWQERIAALEAALEQARVALEEIAWSNDAAWRTERAMQAAIALRKIEEVRRG